MTTGPTYDAVELAEGTDGWHKRIAYVTRASGHIIVAQQEGNVWVKKFIFTGEEALLFVQWYMRKILGNEQILLPGTPEHGEYLALLAAKMEKGTSDA